MGPLETEVKKLLRDRFEGSPEMLNSKLEGRDDFTLGEWLMMLTRGQKDTRDALLRIAREVDGVSGA